MKIRGDLKILLLTAGLVCVVGSLFLRKGERVKGLAFVAAWLVPGAGHVLLGKWKKGVFFFLILGATYLFGMWIVGFRPVSFDDNPFYFVGQYGSGVTLLLAKLRGSEKAIVRPQFHPSWFDPGLLYVCVVGLLNMVVMLNTLDAKVPPRPSGAGAPAAAPAPAGAPSLPTSAPPATEKTT